jgi:hypothetical protein
MDGDNFPLDGTYDMVFSIYSSSTCPPATPLWTENHTAGNGNPVTVTDGMFEVLLGSANPLTNDAIFDGSPIWLAVVVEGDTLCPLKRISSVAHSIRAAIGGDGGGAGDGHSLDAAGGEGPFDVVFVDSTGDVGIGTQNPTTILSLHPGGGVRSIISTGTEEGDDNKSIVLHGAGGGGVPPFKGLSTYGSVGVGTNEPTAKLHVAGDALVENELETSSFKMPTGASDGYVLSSDASGVAAWEPATDFTPVSELAV